MSLSVLPVSNNYANVYNSSNNVSFTGSKVHLKRPQIKPIAVGEILNSNKIDKVIGKVIGKVKKCWKEDTGVAGKAGMILSGIGTLAGIAGLSVVLPATGELAIPVLLSGGLVMCLGHLTTIPDEMSQIRGKFDENTTKNKPVKEFEPPKETRTPEEIAAEKERKAKVEEEAQKILDSITSNTRWNAELQAKYEQIKDSDVRSAFAVLCSNKIIDSCYKPEDCFTRWVQECNWRYEEIPDKDFQEIFMGIFILRKNMELHKFRKEMERIVF